MNKHESSFMTFEKLSLIWGGEGAIPHLALERVSLTRGFRFLIDVIVLT
jgi:hypothetical protein